MNVPGWPQTSQTLTNQAQPQDYLHARQTEPQSTAEYFTHTFARILQERHSDKLGSLPWTLLTENDTVENPLLFDIPPLRQYIAKSSHTTLRYILNALNVISFLQARSAGELPRTLSIIEIGGGYRGQFKILADIFKHYDISVTYTIADLPKVLALVRRYVSDDALTRNAKLEYMSSTNLKKKDVDLFLSFFSLGEIPPQFQDLYIDLYVRGSKYGYIAWNNKFINHKLLDAKKLDVWEIFPALTVMYPF